MRKNELDRFRTLQHLPKLEKSPPLWGKNREALSAYQVPGKCEIWQNLSLRCDADRVKVLQLPHHLLKNSPAFPLASHSQAASPRPTWTRLMVFWSHAANFSLSRNNPLYWQMSGIWHDVHLWFRLCGTWEVPASRRPLGKLFPILGNFRCHNRKSGQCFL